MLGGRDRVGPDVDATRHQATARGLRRLIARGLRVEGACSGPTWRWSVMPLLVGSGNCGTPWERMQAAYLWSAVPELALAVVEVVEPRLATFAEGDTLPHAAVASGTTSRTISQGLRWIRRLPGVTRPAGAGDSIRWSVMRVSVMTSLCTGRPVTRL